VTEDDTSLEEPTTQHIETTWRLLERHVERPKPGDDHCGRCIRLDREMSAAEHFLGGYAVSPQWRRGLANQIGTGRVAKEDVERQFSPRASEIPIYAAGPRHIDTSIQGQQIPAE